ncbi:hypothetical protein A4X06_0g6305 [Tilletia controversa]|uniref:Uncharacterized protein n=2 Tax=Tilletia TaxID=13289 RepID=A0A8X7SV40_9BASI|nr:hypothetical protein CF335_g7122 [Tilletia laevis]KAE8243455.1 hypothetical protein A4X06_0g6305 [Tilletia controversa]
MPIDTRLIASGPLVRDSSSLYLGPGSGDVGSDYENSPRYGDAMHRGDIYNADMKAYGNSHEKDELHDQEKRREGREGREERGQKATARTMAKGPTLPTKRSKPPKTITLTRLLWPPKRAQPATTPT